MRKSTLVARLGALVIGSAMLTSAGAARAADPGPDTQPLNVVAIEGNDAEDQAEALTKALRNAVRASGGWSLSPGDYSMEVLVLSMKCADPPDATCQAKIADEIKVDRYIWGYLKKLKNGNVAGELALWVRGKGTTKTPIEYSANLTEANDDSLKRVANDAFNKLTGGSPKGGVHVKAGAEGGQLFIDGEPIGALTNGEATLQIPSGTHTLMVKAPGYDDAQTQVVIKPGKTSDVALTLTKATPKGGPSGRAIAGVAMLSGGVLVAGAGGIVGLIQISKNSTTEKLPGYQALQDDPGDLAGKSPCDFATNHAGGFTNPKASPKVDIDQAAMKKVISGCNTNKTLTTMEIILYPTGAVLAGVGLYLLITAPSSAKPAQSASASRWSFDPLVGPTGGKLDVTYHF
jgi:PEGA domain